ncbi:hypothetical protein KP509_04G055600 [Ceratopteris richardii]|nr:hypothetical protein KP509_04G055600 [Ceratopteris richardii]
MRLRSGSFRRYGALINEFSIPNGSILRPDPKRILIVYTHITNPNLFGDLPQGYVVVSPVLSMLAYDYDAAAVGRNQSVEALSVSFGSDSMTIQFAEQGPGSFMCASFDMNSVNVTYNPFQGACQVSEFGTFALVSNSSLLERGPASATTTVSGNLPSSPSHRWKIVVGSVVGVVATLALVGLFACGFTSYRRKTKFARMQYYADHGETLQTTTVGNSRVPAAGSTRTLSSIVKEYSG